MGKQKNSSKAKRSLKALPKGLIQRKGAKSSVDINPFELTSRQKKPKHDVHNRPVSKAKNTKHTLESLQRRQTQLRTSLKSSKKANVFVDRRIGQYDTTMSRDDQMLARLVKERSRQSQRTSKFKLDDNDDDEGGPLFLTHKGKKLDPNKVEAIYSDDEDDDKGQLAAVDTELHFGGAGISNEQEEDPYGGSSAADLAKVYGHRKTELDDLITRRRIMKAEKMQSKEAQEDTVEKMDETFGELSQLLRFRKNEKAPVVRPKPTQEDIGMNEWNLEMKQMMMKPKRAATDRTKTPEEIAKEESERLHEMETRRLARMNGDFEQDDLSDISVEGHGRKSKKQQKKKEKRAQRNPDELSDSDDEPEEPEHEAVFTADGLVYMDKDGKVVKKVGDDDAEEKSENESDEESDDSSSDNDDDEDGTTIPLAVGARVKGNYRVEEQFDAHEQWYDAVITQVNTEPDGTVTYDLEYNDNDFEENMIPKNVRAVEKSPEEEEKGLQKKEEEDMLKLKRKKARDNARYVIRMLGKTN
jgi:nucleolar protein 14